MIFRFYIKRMKKTDFYFSIVYQIGDLHNSKLSLASSYFSYLGTSKYSPSELKQEFYKLGCSYSVSTGDEETFITLSGLNENFDKALTLLESVIKDLQPEKEALNNLVSDILKVRADNKLSKDKILWDAMYSYGKYGSKSPYKDILTEDQLKSIDPIELINILKDIPSYKQKVLYYGPLSTEGITEKLNTEYTIPEGGFKETPQMVMFGKSSRQMIILFMLLTIPIWFRLK